MKVIYIAGPYRDKTICRTLDNIRFAERGAKLVWKTHNIAICPHLNTRLFDDVTKPEIFLEGYLELVRRCDALALLPGWEGSMGTVAEYELAEELGIPVIMIPLAYLISQTDSTIATFKEEINAKC